MPAITGDYLSRQLDLIVGQDYSGLLVTARKNKLFRDALLKVAEDSYRGIASQKIRDEMGFIITTEKTLDLTANQFYTGPLQISSITFGGATATITTVLPHNLITGLQVTIENVASTPALNPVLNGNYVATVTTTTAFTIPYVYVAGTYTATSGQITAVIATAVGSNPQMLIDYWHLLNMKCYFSQRVYSLAITNATNATPIVVTLDTYSALRSYESIVISGVVGNTAANATSYIKKMNDFKMALYSDTTLQTGVAGNGTYTSGGVINRVFFNQAKPYLPKTKISSLNTPTVEDPRFEHAKRLLKIYPRDLTCSKIEIDYVRQPDVMIDVSNTIIDYAMYYPEKVLLHIVDVAGEMFTALTRDTEGIKIMDTQIAINP